MVYRWVCPTCSCAIWSPRESTLTSECTSHLLRHFDDAISQTVFRTEWSCPVCDETGSRIEENEAIDSFRNHLISHEQQRMAPNVDLTEDIGTDHNVLLFTPDGHRGTNLARSNLLVPADTVISVTKNVNSWIGLLEQQHRDTPSKVVLLVPSENTSVPSSRPKGFDGQLKAIPMGPDLSVGDIGKRLSKLVDRYGGDGIELACEFDELSTILDATDIDGTFKFIHLLNGVFDRANARALVPFNPSQIPNPSVALLANLFDFVLIGGEDSLKQHVIPDRQHRSDGDGDDNQSVRNEQTYSELSSSNQRVVPTMPSKYRSY